ncbi:MAG: metallophosphoesterase family protein [Bacilli bacterium]|jgi:predicted MPP superfamily phosphohydrolase|nr:metallophosphoesterase family protein [Bacilli bacterium]
MKKYFIFIVAVLLLLGLVLPLNRAATTEVTMVITNPGADMATSIHITYHAGVDGTVVEYTTADDLSYANKQTATPVSELTTFSDMVSFTKTYYRCEVELTGLEPDTHYIYRVGKTAFTDNYHFHTAGGNSFSFVHVTDIHSYDPLPARIQSANAVMEKAITLKDDLRFALASGDVTAYGSYYTQWQNLYNLSALKKVPFVVTPGNHDYYITPTGGGTSTIDNRFFNAVTYYPTNGAEGVTGSTYFFKYNNTLFISLDSEAGTASSALLANQQEWFVDVVKNNPSQFIIVYTHRPFYTGDGLNASQASKMRTDWQKIFDGCGVDVVLSGHNHVYARTYQVHHAYTPTRTGQGTVYFTGIQLGDRYVGDEGTPMSAVAKAMVGKIDGGNVFTVDQEKITMQFVNSAGEILDSATIYPKDSFVEKAGFEYSFDFRRNAVVPTSAFLNFLPEAVGYIKELSIVGEDETVFYQADYPNTINIPIQNIPLDDVEYGIDIIVTYRDDTTFTKTYTIDNRKYNYGEIKDFLGLERKRMVTWDAVLENDVIDKYDIYVDGTFFGTADAADTAFSLESLPLFEEYEIEMLAKDENGEIIYTTSCMYGTETFITFLKDDLVDMIEGLFKILE